MNTLEKYTIYYYLNNEHYPNIIQLYSKHQSTISDYKFYYGLVLINSQHYVEAIKVLSEIKNEGDFKLATLLLLIYSHRKCMDPDMTVLSELEINLKQIQAVSNEKSLTYSSIGLYFIKNLDKALGFAEKVLKINPNAIDAKLVFAWVDFNKKQYKNANSTFKAILNIDSKCLVAIIGEILTTNNTSEQLSKLNRTIVQFPSLSPPLIEKMKILLANKDWIQCYETSCRILEFDDANIIAHKMKLLYLINYCGKYEEAAQILETFFHEIKKQEPDYYKTLYEWSQLFSRLSGRNAYILSIMTNYMKHCIEHKSSNVMYIEEYAYLNYLNEKYDEAMRMYRLATKIDASSISILTGLTLCQFELNKKVINDQIRQQIDLLIEISNRMLSPYISLIQLSQPISNQEKKKILESITTHQFGLASKVQYGFQYLINLNVDLLLTVVQHFLTINDASGSCIELLEKLCIICPGLMSTHLLLTRYYIQLDNYSQAKKVLEKLNIEESHPQFSLVHIILSQIYTREEIFEKASYHLEHALSNDLKLIESSLYNALKGLIEDSKNKMDQCEHSLKNALQIHSQKEKSSSIFNLDIKCIENNILNKLNNHELSLIYQKLTKTLLKLNKHSEIDKYIQEATLLLQNTKYTIDINIMIAEMKQTSNTKYALELLSKVPDEHEKYSQIQEKIGNIYLNVLKNNEKYIECYTNLLNKDPSVENYIRLADAYLNIQDADRAINTYEKAKEKNPNIKFDIKLARIFVKTHQYEKAINCYKECSDDSNENLIELVELYLKLGHKRLALEILNGLKIEDNALTLSRIREKMNDIKGAYSLLKQGMESSVKLQTIDNYKTLAGYAGQLRDFQSAINYYKKALSLCMNEGLNSNEINSINLSLTKLYIQTNDWKSCESICNSIINNTSSNQANNETALLIRADVTFRRCDFDKAAGYFSEILDSNINFTALARYIEIQYRLLNIEKCKIYLNKADNLKLNNTSGYNYCFGLFEWYSGSKMSAMSYFNKAKHDPEWGQQCVHNMVEICLSTENPSNYEIAEQLIKEMNPRSLEEELSCKLLMNFVKFTSTDRIEVEVVLNEFTKLAQNESTRVGASLGLSKCYVHQKQISRARNILKLLAKSNWNFEEANYLESCWLLLADIYIQENKYDRATDLIKQVIGYNKSNFKSYELLASIAEKHEAYGDAITNYRLACRVLGTSNLGLHVKLATLHLKLKQYAYAIDTCQTILKANPNYPKIQKQIYEKALLNLRT